MSESSDMQDKQVDTQVDPVPLTKPKKPRTQKQIEAFEITKQKRQEGIEKRKQEKKIEASKVLLESGQLNDVLPKEKVKVSKGTPKPPVESASASDSDSESSEEEIVIMKKGKKDKKKKKTKKIIIESASDSDSSEEEEVIKVKASQFKSQRNKKSLIKVHEPEPLVKKPLDKNHFKPVNFFLIKFLSLIYRWVEKLYI